MKNYKLIAKVLAKLDDRLKKNDLKFDFKGHYELEPEFIKNGLSLGVYNLSNDQLKLIDTDQKFAPMQFNMPLYIDRCHYCSVRSKFLFDGDLFFTENECKYPGGIKEVTIELNCPSGKLIFANDLRSWYKIFSTFDINVDIGIVETIKAYEKIGLAHGFVGNSCPSIYKIDNKILSISDCPSKEVYDKEKEKYIFRSKNEMKKITPTGKKIGGICTDLWWYSIADFDDFKIRFLDSGSTIEELDKYIEQSCKIVDVTPGIFHIIHNMKAHGESYDQLTNEANHYAKISWNREPEKSFLFEEYKKQNYTIGQCWFAAISEFPYLYGLDSYDISKCTSIQDRIDKIEKIPTEVLEQSAQLFYNNIFFTSSNISWHPNGWGSCCNVESNMPDIKLPPLTKKYSWYPTIYGGTLLCAAKKTFSFDKEKITLNESFLNAAYDSINSILNFGTNLKNNIFSSEEKLKDLILKSIIEFNKNYPNTAPDNIKRYLKFIPFY